MLKLWLYSFYNAWNMLLELTLPETSIFEEIEETEEDSSRILLCFPFVGAVIGFCAYTAIWLLLRLMPLGTAVTISAILLVIGLELISHGKNLSSLLVWLESGIRKRNIKDIISDMQEKDGLCKTNLGFVFLISYIILRIFCVAFLVYYGCISWLIVTLTLSYAVQAEVATGKDIRSSDPFFETDGNAIRLSWLFAVLISFIAGFTRFPAVLAAFALAYLSAYLLKKYFVNKFGGITGKIVGLSGTVAENLILITGVVLLCRK